MVIHRTLREGDPTFREELINYDRRGRTLNMANFKDDSGPAGGGRSGGWLGSVHDVGEWRGRGDRRLKG